MREITVFYRLAHKKSKACIVKIIVDIELPLNLFGKPSPLAVLNPHFLFYNNLHYEQQTVWISFLMRQTNDASDKPLLMRPMAISPSLSLYSNDSSAVVSSFSTRVPHLEWCYKHTRNKKRVFCDGPRSYFEFPVSHATKSTVI